ncbi:GNAT family N-acetyltransferase [Kibdelosporangium aridum]|uniref:Acetyltransferase (GNAT) domain-containing protein n=1 Tax=Kibdelosporangium aridum TaxID=2030 RepID=A0A1W2DQ42_KIBAR|nr:GNAT family N-acetyltransferase [Kibdelosporangium aridum]SMC99142.1 Acetyltransferase (GNAT) domain-containing protein [Kibdelosporangium aridum]
MTKPYYMSRAKPGELDEVMALINQRIEWLQEQNSDQWNTGRPFRTRMENFIDRGETWVLRDGETLIGTVTVRTEGDPDFWTPRELAEKALYIEKMATSITRQGEGLGGLLLSWTQNHASKIGAKIVRWDVWRTNKRLQDYYMTVGARHIRTEDVTNRWSGALFELDAMNIPELANEIVTQGTGEAIL